MVYQSGSLAEISKGISNIFQKRDMHFIHLNVNSHLSKIDGIDYIAKV